MKLAELGKELQISIESFIKLMRDFDLELAECLSTNLDIKKDFEKFARANIEFLKKYEMDSGQNISLESIAEKTNQSSDIAPETNGQQTPHLFDNGHSKLSVAGFGIDHIMHGNQQFEDDNFGEQASFRHNKLIGYHDLFSYISQTLEPFINQSPLTDWGIHKTAGIILYGPPGSGKIFWANKIAEITKYRFEQVKRYYYGTSFIDGKKTSFNDFLLQMMKDDKVLLFMEDFDKMMAQRNEQNAVSSGDEETKEIILHYIGHFENENLLMVGSANSLVEIDKEILAPGRFDVMIPVFPPNSDERLKMILHHITDNLGEDSLLIKILLKNDANVLPFWKEISDQMKVFSNTMIVDFTQSLKKRIRNQYLKNNSDQIKIDSNLLNAALRDASAKLTGEYLDQVNQFIRDISINNYDDFTHRIQELKKELEYYKVIESPRSPIGFQHNDDQPKEN